LWKLIANAFAPVLPLTKEREKEGVMFKTAGDMRYVQFMHQLHAKMIFDWYLEIGCRGGRIFEPVRSKTIAVDPYFSIERNVIGAKPSLFMMQQTSDAFFESGFLKQAGIKLSFSFLDGMHLFEFLLRDFMNVEKMSKSASVIAMHDCCPFSYEMTTRDLDAIPAKAWTGDVWKLLPILRKYRPDLKITVLGCRPTGLVLVSNLSPRSGVLAKHYDEILAEWTDVTLEEYGAEKFYDAIEYTDCKTFITDGFPIFSDIRKPIEDVVEPVYITP
jgi:hypothetical protein